MKIKVVTLFIISFFSITVFAQTVDHEAHEICEDQHEHHDNEFGIANSPVYYLKEKEFTYGLHLHYVRSIENTKFGIGLGYEQIFDAHEHKTVSLVAIYRPIERLSFNFSPGMTFEKENKNGRPGFHLETTYEFEFNNFHVGPAFEVAYDPEDIHVSLGLHVGVGF